jgi:hypothetical protein
MNFRDVKVKVTASKVESKEKFSLVFLKDSRKDKKTDKWVNSPYPNTRFVGSAHEKIDELIEAISHAGTFEDGNSKGVWIILKDVTLSNEMYENKEGVKVYPRSLAVWNWEFFVPEESESDDAPPVVEESNEIPF